MRHNNIVSAIEWLPEHLFTEEIVEAAVESKEIEVLSHIPGRFLTPGRIERIIAGSTESWHSFELRNIPEAYRSGAVCDYAMRKTEEYHGRSRSNGYREMAEAVIRNGRGISTFSPSYLNAFGMRNWHTWPCAAIFTTRITRTAGQTPS